MPPLINRHAMPRVFKIGQGFAMPGQNFDRPGRPAAKAELIFLCSSSTLLEYVITIDREMGPCVFDSDMYQIRKQKNSSVFVWWWTDPT